MPEISIIMPVFNGGKYLSDSIGSIKRTIRHSWELLLCDDGSTDNSREIIKTYQTDNIHVWYFDTNEGPSKRRNELINSAGSDVFFVFDCDNILLDTVVDKMFDMLQGLNIDAVSPESMSFFKGEKGQGVMNSWSFKKYGDKVGLKELLMGHDVPPSSGNYMFKRKVFDAVEGYHSCDIQETWGFGFRHITAGFPIWLCPDTVYLHRFCRDGCYHRLSKQSMETSYWNLLYGIRDKLTDNSVRILEGTRDGKSLIGRNVLKLK